MRLRHLISEDIGPGSVFMLDGDLNIYGQPEGDRLTLLATDIQETPEHSRVRSSHCLMACAKREALLDGKPLKITYGIFCFEVEEGIGGRRTFPGSTVWITNLHYYSMDTAMQTFHRNKGHGWSPQIVCGYEVRQIA
jgi:hypothetical protein